jgi:hypothetical protein
LFTAAECEYATAVLSVFGIDRYFLEVYSGQKERPNSIKQELGLSDSWILVDDSHSSNNLTRHKLSCLGSQNIPLKKCFLHAKSYNPRQEDKNDLRLLYLQIRSRIAMNIKHLHL